jgi:GalNAc5-diNAcBac-PP-undecaprenol beta-1,3-glucosyltransferase
MHFSKITIILATYNRAHLIVETLHSIRNQTYENWECIIVDDFSVDNTKEVIEEFIRLDDRFSYFLKTAKYRKGLSGTRNQGLDIAAERNAEYIQLFDDDDIMHPKKLELQIGPFLADESIDFTICKYRHYYDDEILKFELKDEDCNVLSQNLFEDFYLCKMGINSLGPIWKANLILKYRFDEDLLYAEERDLYLKIFLLEKPNYKNIDYVLFYYRKHLVSNTINRYDSNVKRLSFMKSDLNLFYFVSENNLWNYFILKEMIKKFIIYKYDEAICNEIKMKINSIDKVSIIKSFLLKLSIFSFITFRRNVGKLINKL